MNSWWKQPIARRLLTVRLIEVVIIVVILIGGWFLHEYIREARTIYVTQLSTLQSAPETIDKTLSLSNELRGRQPDIERIAALVVSRDDVGTFVGELEAAAERYGVALEVPEIEQVPVFSGDGQLLEPPPGVFRAVRLKVVTTGTVADLLRFLHDVEHAPFLVEAADWQLSTESIVPTEFTARPLGDDSTAASSSSASAIAVMQAEFILQVHNDGHGSQ